MTLRIRIDTKNYTKINLHLGIYDLNDEKILHLSSEYCKEGSLKTKKNIYECFMPKLTLTEGLYYINAGLVADNLIIEEIKKCLKFEVLNGDFYKCGFNTRKSTLKAKTLIDFEWK